MNILQLLEEFKDYVNGKPVFYVTKAKGLKNSEILEINLWESVRFICVEGKILYIFPGNLMHLYVADKFGLDYLHITDKKAVFFGEANIENKKIFYNDSYDLGQIISTIRNGGEFEQEQAKSYLSKLANTDWSLVSRYILGFDEAVKILKNKNKFYNKEY